MQTRLLASRVTVNILKASLRSAVPLTNVYRTAASVQAPRFGIAPIALGDGAGLPAAARRASPRAAPSLRRSVAASAASAMKIPSAVLFEPESLPSVALAPASGLEAWEGELLVLGVTEEDFATEGEVTSVKSEALAALDSKLLGGVVAEIAAAGGFDGKPGSQSRVVRLPGGGARAKHVALVGLGKAAKLTTAPEWGASPFTSLGNAVAVLAKAQKATAVAVSLLSPLPAALLPGALTQITAGALLGGYETTRFKSKKSPTASKLASVHLLVDAEQAAADAAIARGVATAQGNLLTRYLVEAPPNVCTPTHLADTAAHIAALAPELFELKVYEKEECEAMGMGCYLGVAEASEEPPKFIHLKYTPKGGASRKIAIVGKGLTFDSGGYNLKAGPGSMIEMMKFDMGGAGATLGAARVLAQWQPANVEVHFIIASCENMVAGKGLRPGDILTAANGKTVEVNNTDAEGRLTLADGMWFAQEKCGVSAMVDIATLTGACMVALGGNVAGLFTPADGIAAELTAASKAAGEKLWRMPWEEEYFESMKSPIADMKNTGGRLGGAISAALFLKQFVKEGVEWAHLDVAGPVWNEKANVPTGYGAALLAEWIAAQAAK